MKKLPPAVYFLVALLVVLGIGGLQGGLSLLRDPTGQAMRLPPQFREQLPVPDYFWAGVGIFFGFGLLPLLLSAALLWRPRVPLFAWLERSNGRYWAWTGALALGGVVLLWMAYQIWLLGYHIFVQGFIIAVGVALTALCLVPSVQRFYRVDAARPTYARQAAP